MKPTPIKREVVDGLIQKFGIQDFAKATIREVKQVAATAEKESGVEFITIPHADQLRQQHPPTGDGPNL